MATERERKFLVTGGAWRAQVVSERAIRQAYLASTPHAAIRIRISDDSKAVLTIKSAEPGIERSEFEYAVPLVDAEAMIALRTGEVIEKRRHVVPAGDLTWEIDVFAGAHDGLVMAEIELPTQDTPFESPDWLGEEVTGDRRYYNASMALGEGDGD
jgi:adenylate cyclase